MRRRGREVLLLAFEPPDAAAGIEFSDAQLALIEIGRRQSVLKDPVDALQFALAQRQIEERLQGGMIDEIIAAVGRKNREWILAAEAKKLGVTPEQLKSLLEDPPEFRALIRIKAQAHLADIPAAQESLADHRRRTAEQGKAALDRWDQAFNKSKPGRGDWHYGMNQLGEMVVAEMTAEKQAKAAARKLHQAERPAPKKRKPSWKEKLAPGAKEAGAYFMATGEGIVPMKLEQLNIATGREAQVLADAAALDEWDGFPWPTGED